MNDVEIKERFALMWRTSRADAEKSQEWVAKKLGVSKRTVQNWESGYSCPTQLMGLRWFKVLGLQPLPYYFRLIYNEYDDFIPSSADETAESVLIKFIHNCTPQEQRKLLFMLYGQHGSSADGVIEMVVAHLHVPLKDRLNIAQNIINNYEIAESHDTLVCKENIMPNMEVLKQSFENAKESVKQGNNSYTNVR